VVVSWFLPLTAFFFPPPGRFPVPSVSWLKHAVFFLLPPSFFSNHSLVQSGEFVTPIFSSPSPQHASFLLPPFKFLLRPFLLLVSLLRNRSASPPPVGLRDYSWEIGQSIPPPNPSPGLLVYFFLSPPVFQFSPLCVSLWSCSGASLLRS